MADGAVASAELDIPLGTDVGTDVGADTGGVDVGTDVGGDDPGSDGVDGVTGSADPGVGLTPGQQQTEPFAPFKDGKLSEPLKQHLETLKSTNPAMAKALRDALFSNDRYSKALPGGLKEYQTIRAALDDVGGVDGIQQLRGDLQRFSDLDAAFTAGDPKFVQALTDTPENQAAFLQVAPALLDKYREFHPEGFDAAVTQRIVSDMMAERIPLALERLGDFLGDNAPAKEVLAKIQAWVTKIDTVSRAAPKAPARAAAQPDKRVAELDKRETQLRQTEFTSAADSEARTVFDREWTAQMAGRNLTADKIAAVKELYGSRAMAMLKARPKFNETASAFFQNKQKDGYLRHVKSAYEEIIPKALKAALDTIAGPKPGPKPGQAQPQAGARPQVQAQTGWSVVAKSPATAEINYQQTTADMIREGKAVLHDGKRVQWR